MHETTTKPLARLLYGIIRRVIVDQINIDTIIDKVLDHRGNDIFLVKRSNNCNDAKRISHRKVPRSDKQLNGPASPCRLYAAPFGQCGSGARMLVYDTQSLEFESVFT